MQAKRFYLKILRFMDKPEFCDARLWRVTGSGVQDSRSMKPRFRSMKPRFRIDVRVCCASTLHAPRWCILSRIKVKKAACTLFQASPHHVLRSPPMLSPAQWQSNRKPERTKKSHSLDINAITTRLHTAAKRRAVKRSPTRLFCSI